MPGLDDLHVYVDYPEKDHREEITSATHVADVGDTTTALGFPIDSVPTTVDQALLALKILSLYVAKHSVDARLIGRVTPSNAQYMSSVVVAGPCSARNQVFPYRLTVDGLSKVTLQHFRRAILYIHDFHSSMREGGYRRQITPPIQYILHSELDDCDSSSGARAAAQTFFN